MRQPTAVIYARLSRDSEESTSIKAQVAACEAYAEARGWRVLFVSDVDVDVSGATKLEDRPGMARVLAALTTVNFVIAAKLDRYARSVLEFSRLLKVTEDSGATLVTADGTLSPDTSKLVVHVLSAFAEYERDMIKARITASKEHLRSVGRWLGGLAPYGYKLVKRDGGTYLEIDEDAAKVVRECANRLLHDGVSLTNLMHDLNAREVLPPADHARKRDGRKVRGTKWSTTTLRDVLITPAARGFLVQAPKDKPRSAMYLVPVLDANGEPHRVGPELLDADTWTTLRSTLEARSVGRGATRTGKALLLHVVKCQICGGPMYHQRRIMGGRDYSTYVCGNGVGKNSAHVSNVVQASGAEQQTEAEFLRRFGRANLMIEVKTGGRDVAREIRETEDAIDNLSGNLSALPAGSRAANNVVAQLAALETKLATLHAEDAVPEVTQWVPTGRTVAEEWAARDTVGRNALLREYGTVTTITPLPRSAPRRYSEERANVAFEGPAWYRDDPAAGELLALAHDLMGDAL